MSDFYFIRHAQTEANAAQIMCGGGVDTPLTSLGIEQAHKAQEILKQHHAQNPVSQIIHSDMKRTRKTAQILNDPFNLSMIPDSNIKEHIVGNWEGLSWVEIQRDYIDVVDPPAGEPFLTFQQRIHKAFNAHLQHINMPLFVAHGGVWRGLIASYGLTASIHPNNAELYFFKKKKDPIDNNLFPWDIFYCHANGDIEPQSV